MADKEAQDFAISDVTFINRKGAGVSLDDQGIN